MNEKSALTGLIAVLALASMVSAQNLDCTLPASVSDDECLGVPIDPALGDPTNLIPFVAPLIGLAVAGALASGGGTSTPNTTNQ